MTTNAAATGFWTAQTRNNARQGRALLQALMLAGAAGSPLTAARSGVILTNGDTTKGYDGFASVVSGQTINVAPVVGVINRPGQGPYLGWLLPASVNVTTDAPPATNPRNDMVVMRIYDAAQGDTVPASGPCQIEVITGSPAASPSDPLTPDSTGAITSWAGLPVPAQGTGGGVAIPLWRAQVATSGTVTLTDIRRSAGLLGGMRALLPGDSLTDPSYMAGDMRWYNGVDIWDGAKWNPMWRASTPLGVVGTYSNAVGGTITGTDVVQPETVTVAVASGRRYKMTHTRAEAGGNILTNTYRVQAGGTLTTSGTAIRTFTDTTPGSFRTLSRVSFWDATFTGNATFGLSSHVNTGTNTVDPAAARDLVIEDVGI